VSPLTIAASTLLQLLAGLRQIRRPPDPGQLRESAIRELRAFERRGRDAGIKLELLNPAHYALCATLDDVVLNTPWGNSSAWAAMPLVSTFHQGSRGVGQFFSQLRELLKNPEKFLPVIELMYLCLSLGSWGRFRQTAQQGAELDRLRAETHAVIAARRKTSERVLSPRWKGITAPYRSSRGRVPVWVVMVAALVVCGGLFFFVSTRLNAQSDALRAELFAAPPSHMPRIERAAIVQPLPQAPAPSEPGMLDVLRARLKTDIETGQVSVLGSDSAPIIRIGSRGVFAAGSATIQQTAVPLLERIGTALKDQSTSIQVRAYTDNQPLRSVRFPSNFQLTVAQAEAVRRILERTVGGTTRISAEGQAEADPIAANTTAEGREQNRRIEIALQGQS
jgi:type VI secretion system protein ImpK